MFRFFLSRMITAVYCIACCHPTWSWLHHAILGAAFWIFLSQYSYFLISVWFVAKSGFFFFRPSGWCLPTKTRKITACNASLSGNQSAQPPPRGYSSEGDSGGTLSEGQQMRFCCWGKLFPEPYNMCHISCLNCCHWAEERQQKRFEGMDIEELGSKDTQVGRKFQEARQLWHCNTVLRVMSQNPEDCTSEGKSIALYLLRFTPVAQALAQLGQLRNGEQTWTDLGPIESSLVLYWYID